MSRRPSTRFAPAFALRATAGRRSGQAGSALLVVMILAIALATAGAALLPAVQNAGNAARSETDWVRAGHIADAGVETALAMMRAGDDVSGNIVVAVGDGNVLVRVDASGRKDTFVVEAVANLSDRPEVLRTIRATVRRDGRKVQVVRWERP